MRYPSVHVVSVLGLALTICGLACAGACAEEPETVAPRLNPKDLIQARNQDGEVITLNEYLGRQPLVLFFYPKSFTPGCTREVRSFQKAIDALRALDAVVFGVSSDDPKTQKRFCEAENLSYDLLADTDGRVAEAFGVTSRAGFHARWTVVVGRAGEVTLTEREVSKDIAGHPARIVEVLQKDLANYRDRFTPLFNGKDLKGWHRVNAEPDTWQVKDGILTCSGKPTGYIRTVEPHSDYALFIEYRYPDAIGNAGVLVHIQGEDKVWPTSIEPNLNRGQMGKFYFIAGSSAKHAEANPLKVITVEPNRWYRMEVRCPGDRIEVLLNGERVNRAHDCKPARGTIGFQSEGTPIQFRTIGLHPLKPAKNHTPTTRP